MTAQKRCQQAGRSRRAGQQRRRRGRRSFVDRRRGRRSFVVVTDGRLMPQAEHSNVRLKTEHKDVGVTLQRSLKLRYLHHCYAF